MKKILYIIGGVMSFAMLLDIFKLGQIGKKYNRYEPSAWSEGETWPLTGDLLNGLFHPQFILLLIFGYIFYLISSVVLNFPKKKNQSKKNELPSEKNEYQEKLSQIKKVADEIKAKKKERERKKSQEKKSKKNDLPSDKNNTVQGGEGMSKAIYEYFEDAPEIYDEEIENPYQKYMPKDTIVEEKKNEEVKEKIEVVKQEEIENKDEKTEDKKSEYNSIIDELTKLGALKEKGLLTEDEFNEQKKKLLKQ